MTNKIVEGILREADVEDLLEVLSERLSPTKLQSLLLEVYRRRAAGLSPRHVIRQYAQNRFVKPSPASPELLLELDRLAYSLLPVGFETLELSPVSPLGSCSVVATVNQHKAVTTVRNTEVCSDSTNVLALECAMRRQRIRKSQPTEQVKLCASHRLVRAQFIDGPAMFPHFRLLGLCTAGRDEGSHKFEIESLVEHIDYHVRLLKEVGKIGLRLQNIRATLTSLDGKDWHGQVLDALSEKHPDVPFTMDPERQSGRGYYLDACFCVFASDTKGEEYFLADGGFTDWTRQWVSDRKERLFISGTGSERMCMVFAESFTGRRTAI